MPLTTDKTAVSNTHDNVTLRWEIC